MQAYHTDNEHLERVVRALHSGDEAFARDAINEAATFPHLVVSLKRILRELGKAINATLAKLLQDAIAEWETGESGTKGGEATTLVEPIERAAARR